MSDVAPLENVQDILPLSPTQEGMLFEILSNPGAVGRYDSIQRITLEGPVDPQRFERIFADVALAPDVSRACFVHEGTERPVQVIRTHVALPFVFEDWSMRDDVSDAIDALENEIVGSGCDLTAAPLMSLHLIRQAPEKHVVLWRVHHLISDAWSARVVLQDVLARMNGAAAGPPGPPFRDSLLRQMQRDRATDRAFFKAYLEGLEGPCLLAGAGVSGQARFRRISSVIPRGATERLNELARDQRVTAATVLSTAWALCLRRLTGQEDVVFGRVNAGRDPSISGIERAVGPYLTVIPTRMRLHGSNSVLDTLTHAESSFRRLRNHETAALADALSATPGTAEARLLFDTLISIQGFGLPESSGELRAVDISSSDATGFPLAILIRPAAKIRIDTVFDESRLSEGTVAEIVSSYVRMVTAMTEHPDRPIRDLPGTPLPDIAPAPSAPLVHRAFLEHAHQTPEATAVICGTTRLSYGAFQTRAAVLAEKLREAGVGRGDIVPIVASRSVETPVAMLATLYTGASYAPMDPDYPDERNRAALQAICPKVAIGDTPLPGWDGPMIAVPDPPAATGPFEPAQVAKDDAAYVIFTSGSQGKPKGVVVSHGNLAWSTAARQPVYGRTPDVFLHLSSFSFDSSVVGLYWTLASGGTLVIAPQRAEQDVGALLRTMTDEQVTDMLCLPRVWSAMLEASDAPKALKTVIVAGEAVERSLPALHRTRAPHVRLFNEYGPTEATVWCAAADITSETGDPPIGAAPPGAALDICDMDGWSVPCGLTGEIVVRGDGLSQGYLGDATPLGGFVEGSERRYRTGDVGTMRADGAIFCHGRLDEQVKIRGHRVELGEIEAAARIEGAGSAAAIAQDGRIILAMSNGPKDLDARLARHLPPSMRPAIIHTVTSLPRLPNGKIDRKAIAKMGFGDHAAEGTAEGFFETALASIWSEALGRPVGPGTHFFEAGGDSLMTISVLSAAEAKGLTLLPGDMFDFPVLGDLAATLRHRLRTPLSHAEDPRFSIANPGAPLPPVMMIHGSHTFNAGLAAALGSERPYIFYWSHHLTGGATFRERVETLADEAVAALNRLQPDGPCNIGGFSLGAIVAMEAAQRLAAMGRPVTMLFMVDPSLGIAPPKGTPERPDAFALRWARAARARVRALLWGWRGLDRVVRAQLVYQAILAPYRPHAYRGETLVLQNSASISKGKALLAVTPTARRVALPYDHTDLLEDPNAIADIAARIVAALRAKEKEAPS